MSTTTWRARARRTLAAVTTTALAAGAVVAGTGTTALAAEPAATVTSGSAQWGVKASFRTYLGMPFAGGKISIVPPATATDTGYEFAAARGTVTATTADLALDGGVDFWAHEGALEVRLSELRVTIDGDEGSLVADVVSRANTPDAELVDYDDVTLGTIDLDGHPLTVADGVATVTGAPVTLTAEGAPAFANFYKAGDALDPLSFSVELAPTTAAPQVTLQPQDVSVDAGDDALFSAAATGTPQPTVQWQTRPGADTEWQDVAEATATDLTLPAVTAEQNGRQLRAVFRNGTEPDAVTAAATLAVAAAPVEPVEPEEPVAFEPAIEVFAADGVTPLGDAEVTFGDSLVVKGTGFDPAGNVGGRGMPIPADLPQGTYVVFGKFAEQWQPSQGAPSSARVVGAQKWALAESVLDQVPPAFQGAIRKDWVAIEADGSFEAELVITDREAGWSEDGAFGVYTYAASGVKNPAQELSVPLEVVEEPSEPVEWAPVIEVFAADGVTPVGDAQLTDGDTVVVKGAGFDPAANVGGRGVPIPNTLPQGTYVVLGKFAEQWQPSLDAPSSTRVVGSQKWALAENVLDQVPPTFQDVIRRQWVDIAEDGSFTAELTITKPAAGWPEDGTFGVYTYAAGGVKNSAQELSVPLDVVEERTPQLAVTPTEDITVGTVVSVEGTGYAPNRKLSVAFTSDTPTADGVTVGPPPTGWLQHEVVTTDALGSFEREITVRGWFTGTEDDCSQVQCYLATFTSAQLSDAGEVDVTDRSQDVFVPVTFVAGSAEPTPEPGAPAVVADPSQVEQGDDVTISGSNLPAGDVRVELAPSTATATGHLDWGVKESFRSYVTSPIAHGTITTSEDVTRNDDGTFRFPATLASQDPAAGTALVSFAGSVQFEGHEIEGVPALDVLLENLRVQVTPDSAVLVADATSREFAATTSTGEPVDYPGVVLASLDPEAFTVAGGEVSAEAAAATLTTAGVPAFGTFYDAGDELDPVSVDVTVGGAAPAALALPTDEPTEIAVVTVEEDGSFTTSWTVPEDFPLGGYAVVLRDEAGAVLASDALTVLAVTPDAPSEPGEPGEEPAEPGEEPAPTRGSVTVSPDPVVQGATATLTGSGLEPGTRVGAVIDAAGAPGSLTWGVKQSFRDYITGSIAHGSVTVTAPASETAGGYVFGDGRGNGDATDGTAHFGGEVAFAGHEIGGTSQLQMTVTDPSVVIEGGEGYLVADVASRSLQGDGVVDYPRVRLAELDLDAVQVAGGRLVGTDVPASLTAAGVPAFADFYKAGEALDPVTFSVPVAEGELDLSELDVAAAVVGQDGTVELSWTAPADIALGSHRVDLVTDGESVADTTFTVAAAGAGTDTDDDGAGPGTTAGGAAGNLAQTGAQAAALAALAATVLLAGLVLATRRQRA
ncbi:HtaA domain-containing protein [Georgenia satyanarayanai]|uniref:HtaA domain-containing protein n=1 Tax=Georgenia satyanarayanai TaxID=860221 RepID=UPI00203A53B2|nr:HtaA domain-containing protein [Georgenia satyanarayanai]MCM3662590.1 HtaA domain-containing protein [Georgenia satyanarayanai]